MGQTSLGEGAGLALPVPLTPLVGREREIAAGRDLFSRDGARLVTLAGPGGVGKTRLGLGIAAELSTTFSDGIRFTPLAPLADPAFVGPAIATAMGVRETGDRSLQDSLLAHLRGKRLLLVLDNFEHLLAAAPLVADLLNVSPGLAVLVTSRSLLRISGEHALVVPPLSVPTSDDNADASSSAAVRLFLSRARAVKPDFAESETNLITVAEIVRRLDGLPLAIELAAARSNVLSPQALLIRLDRRLTLLTGGPRDQPARQQTLRDAIGWSYDLLAPEIQRLFRRLAIFASGFTLETAELVLAGAEGDELDVLTGISVLVDNSLLVQRDGQDGTTRFGMLQTIREFALEELRAKGEDELLHRLHAEHVLAVAEQAEMTLGQIGADAGWLNRLEADHDDIRAALSWLLEAGNGETAVRVAAALWSFWHYHSHFSEGRRWLRAALDAGSTTPPTPRIRAMLGAAFLAHYQGDVEAIDLADRALELARSVQDEHGIILALLARGIVAEDHGDYERAESACGEAYTLAASAGQATWVAVTLVHLGIVAVGRGELDLATERLTDALRRFRELPDPWGSANALGYLGLVASSRGDYPAASALQIEALELFEKIGSREGVAGCLANIATLAASAGHAETALRLFAAADTLAEAIGWLPRLPERDIFDRASAIARNLVTPSVAEAAWTTGRALPTTEAMAMARAIASKTADDHLSGERTYPGGLSSREVEVLRLAAAGLTTAQIADRLYLSPHTIRVHLHHIYAKLEISTRSEAVRFAFEHDLT